MNYKQKDLDRVNGVRRVKGWAILTRRNGNFILFERTRKEAWREIKKGLTDFGLRTMPPLLVSVPCTITYKLPTQVQRKRGKGTV